MQERVITPGGIQEHVLNFDTLILEVYNHLPLLVDILAWRATNSRTCKVGSEVVSARFMYMPELCHVMHVTRAVITGSCAWQMLNGDDTPANNLNLIVTNGGFDAFCFLIQDTLLYEWVEQTSKPHYTFNNSAERFARFKFKHLFITVTEAKVDGLFKVVLCAPTTADMLFMTAGGVGMLYLEWTSKNIAVINRTARRGNRDYDKVGCLHRGGFLCHDDTSFLSEACGQHCPTQWRYIADRGNQSLVVDWDARFSLRSMMRASHMIWRLAEHCHNGYSVLPPIPMPCDLATIQAQEAHIDNHMPHYAGKRVALLYATLATAPHLVTVPLRDGVKDLTHLSQLETSHWLDHLKLDKFIVLTGCLRKTFKALPGATETPWVYGYTVIREDPRSYPPPNALIRELAGNVLVIKHEKDNKHVIVNMTVEDVDIVNTLIKRYMNDKCLERCSSITVIVLTPEDV
ncbi:hypothetical protein BD769DRAFT_1381530 [Suillus cothurnatus]|nr:hypothetical protein BD769DRAFT_1381530 [Suillus cothurnatus]